MANGNGDTFSITRSTLIVLVAVVGPCVAIGIAGSRFREQIKLNEQQQVRLEQNEKDEWHLEQDVKRLREDVDGLMQRRRGR